MSFGESIKAGFTKYAVFEGRSGVREFWWWTLFNVIIFGGLFLLGLITASASGIFSDPYYLMYSGVFGMLAAFGFFYFLAQVANLGLMIPNVAMLVRRLRDTGRPAWYLFLLIVPIAGFITLLVMCAQQPKN